MTDSNVNAPELIISQSAESSNSSQPSVSRPENKKRQSLPTPLLPASKQARLEKSSPSFTCEFEEEEMDKTIKSFFIGKHKNIF